MKKVGFWWSATLSHLKEYADLPRPHDHVDPDWDAAERTMIIDYVEDPKFASTQYRGMSQCRFCAKFNGSKDYTDGTYLWPQGFGHYLKEHEVKPPQDFIDHVLARVTFAKKYETPGRDFEKATKEISDGARRAALRNPNYEQMSAREQWEEDKELGILDWDGD